MRFPVRMIVIAAVLAAGGCATDKTPSPESASAREGRQCFWPASVSGFSHVGRDQLRVETGPKDVYLLETLGSCPDAGYSEQIAFDARGPGMLCTGETVTIIVPTPTGPQRCPARIVRKLSEDELKPHKD